MSEKVIEHQNALGIVALAMIVIVLYSLWGASVLRAQENSQYSAANQQAQLARN